MSPSRKQRAGWALVAVLIAAAVASVVAAVFVSAATVTTVRKSQVTNTGTLNNTDRTLEILLDCTDPTGGCYRRGQEAQKAAIDDITVIAAAAAACANRPENATVKATLDCTLRELDTVAGE